MSQLVYSLCCLTSAVCGFLLFRSYRMQKTPILLWTMLCFFFLAVNNALLLIDMEILPTQVNLSLPRNLTSLAALGVMIYGLIWEIE